MQKDLEHSLDRMTFMLQMINLVINYE